MAPRNIPPNIAFEVGAIVRITTSNRGEHFTANKSRRRPPIEVWGGRVVGPSPLGEDLWLVKRLPRKVGGQEGGVYTVPAIEMELAKRPAREKRREISDKKD
jgi:hypothetical protein